MKTTLEKRGLVLLHVGTYQHEQTATVAAVKPHGLYPHILDSKIVSDDR